jgi:large repetitive protein
VTIQGKAFVEGVRVTFGGVAATAVTLADETSVTAVAPAHAAGAVDVVVTNPDKQSATLKDGFTYQ